MNKRLYPYIRMWGIQLGSNQWYIEDEVQRAINDNAPETAISRIVGPGGVSTGKWSTIDDMANLDLKHRLEKSVRERYPQWSPA